jgi:putative oxidoreductase
MLSEANKTLMLVGRLLIATIFFMNAFGVVDQARPAQEMTAHGVPAFAIVPMLWAGRIAQLIGGVLLLFSNRVAVVGSFVLAAFLIPATLIGHDFWAATGDFRQAQLVGFLKNLAILGALVVIAAHNLRPSEKHGSR